MLKLQLSKVQEELNAIEVWPFCPRCCRLSELEQRLFSRAAEWGKAQALDSESCIQILTPSLISYMALDR